MVIVRKLNFSYSPKVVFYSVPCEEGQGGEEEEEEDEEVGEDEGSAVYSSV